MLGKDIKLKPLTGKDAKFFWSQVRKSGKPSQKALKKLNKRLFASK